MKWLFSDGDLGLLLLFIAAGVLPVYADFVHGRSFGAEATLGGLVAVLSLVALAKRAWTHLRADSLRRRLMRL